MSATRAIIGTGIGKRYRIGRLERYRTLRDTLRDGVTWPVRVAMAALRGRPSAENAGDLVWALKDVSFEVETGEVLGVIGRNGAGKSTLLKILARITDPTEGSGVIRGRVGALLELGVGFHPELTGRENIYLNGAILGMSRAEIRSKFDEIVEFSGNERFIDTPVKRYSSGMQMRLGFAVAAHLDPEILLVDEVLAVGDVAFQEKCLKKVNEVATTGRTALFVSHNLAAVRKLCTRALVLEAGRVRFCGGTEAGIEAYLESLKPVEGGGDELEGHYRYGSGSVRVVGGQALPADRSGTYLRTEAAAEFRIRYRARERRTIETLNVGIVVVDALGVSVFTCATAFTRRNFVGLPPEGTIVCAVDRLPLIPGTYALHVSLKDHTQADYVYNVLSFTVVNAGDTELFEHPGPRGGSVAIAAKWSHAVD